MEVIFKIWSQASVVGRVTSLWAGLGDGGIAVDLLAETRYLLFIQCLKCLLGLTASPMDCEGCFPGDTTTGDVKLPTHSSFVFSLLSQSKHYKSPFQIPVG